MTVSSDATEGARVSATRRDAGFVVATPFIWRTEISNLRDAGRDVLADYLDGLTKAGNVDGIRVVNESDRNVGWAVPDPDPIPWTPSSHRSGTAFSNESEEMRAACVDSLRQHLGADTELHEVRHQNNGYHTDLVYADLDEDAVAKRDAITDGDGVLHDPLQQFKVWWSLYEQAPVTYEDATQHGVYSDPSKNRRHVDALLDAGLAARSKTGVVTAVMPPSLGDLHAVELKLRDWETALEQAARANRSEDDLPEFYQRVKSARWEDRWGFADYRWVALDAGAIPRALEHEHEFRERGVGLLGIAEGGTVVEHVDAEYAPRNRYTRDRAWAESELWEELAVEDYVDVDESATAAQGSLSTFADGGATRVSEDDAESDHDTRQETEESGRGTIQEPLPDPGEVRALNGLSWEPWVLVTRVEPDKDGNMVARFAVIDEMDDDVLSPIPDSRFADIKASIGDREWREIIAEQVDENDEIDKRWCPPHRLDVLGKPGIQGCDTDEAEVR